MPVNPVNLDNFEDVTPSVTRSSRNPRGASSKIYVTMKERSMSFPKSVNSALNGTAHVKILINSEDKQFMLMPAEEGVTFLKAGRKEAANIIWSNKDLVGKIKAMLPEGQKEGVRIQGTIMDEGIVFDCKVLTGMRGRR